MEFNQAANIPADDANEGKFAHLLQKIDELAKVEGIRQVDLLALAAPLDTVFSILTRQGAMTTGELAQDLGLTVNQAEIFVKLLLDKGYISKADPQTDKAAGYKVRFATRKKRTSSQIWDSLDF